MPIGITSSDPIYRNIRGMNVIMPAVEQTYSYLDQQYSITTRGLGAVQGVAGVAAANFFLAAAVATSFTGVGAVVFGAAAIYSADVAAAGFKQAITGQYTPTLTAQAVEYGYGIPTEKTDLVLGIATFSATGIAIKAIAGGMRTIPVWTASGQPVNSTESIGGALIPKIGGRAPINSKYAGQVHPSGVRFTDQGFPDFRPYAKAEVGIEGLTGVYRTDAALANSAVGLKSIPKGYVWHHVEDGYTMQLIPQAIHNSVRHTGGARVIRNGGFD